MSETGFSSLSWRRNLKNKSLKNHNFFKSIIHIIVEWIVLI